jgi:hypothetical protein
MVSWLVRTAALALTVLVGGGPAIAVVCETICAPQAAIEDSGAEAAAHSEHHHPAVHEHAGTDGVGADADHVDHQQTDAAAGDSRWSAFSRDCCREFAPPRYSLAASRVDANLLPASHAALLSFGASLTASDLQSDEPIHGPPVGDLSPARVPLVLRI